jgi:hypothetical protein
VSADHFPYLDREGHPLGIDCFVRVERESKRMGHVEFAGLVVRSEEDPRHGILLTVRVWSMGEWKGGERLARPNDCTVRRKPRALREEQAAIVGAKLRLRDARTSPGVRR